VADAVAEGEEVAVLEGGGLHFGFVETIGPFAGGAGLGDDDELGVIEGEGAHALGIVAVIADGDADSAVGGVIDGHAGVSHSFFTTHI